MLWEDQPLNKKHSMTIGEAREHCEDLVLSYFGMEVDGWRLPTTEALKELSKYHKKFNYDDNGVYWSIDISKRGKPMMVVMVDGKIVEAYHPAMPAHVRCVKTQVKGYPNRYTPLSKIMNVLAMVKNEKMIHSSKKPLPPHPVSPKILQKDEFETSEMFAKRVAVEKERVTKINLKQKERYEEALQKYKQTVKKKIHTPVVQNKMFPVGKAMFIKYGKPLIRSVRYNADEEVFDISIVSERAVVSQDDLHKNLLHKEVILEKGLYSISSIVHVNEHMTEVTIKAYKGKRGFYFGRHFGAKVWDIDSKEWLALQDYDREWSLRKGEILKFKIPRIDLMYYGFRKNKVFINNTPTFQANYRIHVPLAFAKKFKTLLLEKAFDIPVKVSRESGKIVINGLEGIDDPKRWVAEHEFSEVHESIEGLEKFIETYKDEPYIKKALQQKEYLEALQAERAKEDAKKAKQRAMREAKEREAYTAKKRVGDKVCMEGKMLLFMTVKISGYVEAVQNGKIQIRIADTEGQTPNYHGVRLRQGTMIWDEYDRWKGCE